MRVPAYVPGHVRIGVAIAIPAPYAEALTRARVDAGDPEALAIAPHVTLIPPTSLEPTELEEVRGHLARVARETAPFVVELAGTDTFRPISPVVFVALQRGSQQCEMLHRAVNAGPLAQQMRFPYHPHVTIAHDLDDASLDAAAAARADFSATFAVGQLTLYEYGDDGVWREVEVFALTASPPG